MSKGFCIHSGKKLTEQRLVELAARAFVYNIVVKEEDKY
jgi:hypothetical protein